MSHANTLVSQKLDDFEMGLEAFKKDDLERTEQIWLALAERVSSDDCRKVADALSALATAYSKADNLVKAEQLLLRALELRHAYLPANDDSIAVELNNIGMIYDGRNNRAKAIEFLEKAIAILDELAEITKPNLADPYDNLASLLFATGPLGRARTLCQRGLDIRDATLGRLNPRSAMSLDLLAQIQEAEKPHCRAARETKKELSSRLSEMATMYDRLGDPLLKQTLLVAAHMGDKSNDMLRTALSILARDFNMLPRAD
jgi:tetratricopeptide (TPR) repeat protein